MSELYDLLGLDVLDLGDAKALTNGEEGNKLIEEVNRPYDP